MRYFFQRTDPKLFADLTSRWAEMLGKAGLFPEHSSYPGDPPEQGVSVSRDGMLHEALSRPSCQLATDECYYPLPMEHSGAEETRPEVEPPSQPLAATEQHESSSKPRASDPLRGERAPAAGDSGSARALVQPVACRSFRRCRARQYGREARQARCQRASALDPEARFIHYQGHNGKHQGAGRDGVVRDEGGKGKNVFGFRSIAERVLGDRWFIAWIISSGPYSANTDERAVFLARTRQLTTRLPELKIGEWLDDSGVGFGECLDAIWQVGALRMVDIREDPGDKEFETCLRRGYDGKGRPLCAHGYPMRSNGYDHQRRRAKYLCDQVCRRAPLHDKRPISPPEGCPYLDDDHRLGQVVNVGRAFRDGSVRLAREIPYGSDAWKARYGRRNLSESRNAQIEALGLKRMRSYGLGRNRKEVQLADFLINLHTLGRLVREATDLDSN